MSGLSILHGNKKGDSIIFVVMVLSILFLFIAMLLLVFGFWQRAAVKMLFASQAGRVAKIGMEQAIWYLDDDCRKADSFYDGWRTAFEGNDVDISGNGIPDARWIYVMDRNGYVAGRYAVLVEDENGKIDINAVGIHDNHLRQYINSPENIDLLSNLIGTENALNVTKQRLQRRFIDPSDIKLVDGIGEKTYEKIRGLITTFSYDRNVNRYEEQRININSASFETLYSLFLNLGYPDILAAQIALNIVGYRDRDGIPRARRVGGDRLTGISMTPYLNEINAVKKWEVTKEGSGMIISEKGGQYIELFNPYPEAIDIGGWKITGVATLLQADIKSITEISQSIIEDISDGAEYIEEERFAGITGKPVPTYITIPEGTYIGPHSFYTIGDLVRIVVIILPKSPPIPLLVPTVDPGGCDQYEPIIAINPGSLGFISDLLAGIPVFSEIGLDFTVTMYDRNNNVVEIADYFVDTPLTSVQKNDPRVSGRSAWFLAPPTPKEYNSSFFPFVGGDFGKTDWILNWPSSFDVKRNDFYSVGELSLIHRGSQWQTLDFWRTGADRHIIDYLTVFPSPEEPARGKININTADYEVLKCLPGVDSELAQAIMEARPYQDISEVLGIFGDCFSRQERLARSITRFGFDMIDNNRDGFVDNEKEKELIFAGIIDLITVRGNVFKISVIGQKMQNVGNNDTIENGVKIASEKKITVWYDRHRGGIIHSRELE